VGKTSKKWQLKASLAQPHELGLGETREQRGKNAFCASWAPLLT